MGQSFPGPFANCCEILRCRRIGNLRAFAGSYALMNTEHTMQTMLNPSAMPTKGPVPNRLQHPFKSLALNLKKHFHSWHPLLPMQLQGKNFRGNPNFGHRYAPYFPFFFFCMFCQKVPCERTPTAFSEQTFQNFEKLDFMLNVQ